MRRARPFVAHPPGWRLAETWGVGPFTSRAVYEIPGAGRHEWTSRRHRTGRGLRPLTPAPGGRMPTAPPRGRRLLHPTVLGWWIGVLFMVGSACFALASLPGVASRADPATVGVTFVVGAAFFTAAAALQHLQTLRAERTVGPPTVDGRRGAGRVIAEPGRLDWWATAVQLVGTVFFNITTIASLNDALDTQEKIARVWAPDALGSVCFLVASYLAVVEVCHRWWWHPGEDVGVRIAGLNMLGSIFFGVSAITSFILPDTGEVLNAEATNAFTFLGAVCFLVGARLVAVEAVATDDGRERDSAAPADGAPSLR